MRTLERRELTAALAARQLLIERRRLGPVEAIRRLSPLQAQHPRAPYLALAARLDNFARADLEAAIAARRVVKTTLMRHTLHLVAAADYPGYAQVARQARLRAWRKAYPGLDEARVAADLGRWLREPHTNEEIRERLWRYDGAPGDEWAALSVARTLLPLVRLPPAGFWDDRRRPRFIVDPRPLPDPAQAAALVLARYLAAFGPASPRDAAAWAGVAQRDLAPGWERLETNAFRDGRGTELRDLPGAPLPGATTRLPARLLAHWEQPLLAYADRERILPDTLRAHGLTLSGAPTVTVAGRVAGRWELETAGDRVRVVVHPLADFGRAAQTEIRAEAERIARFAAPGADTVEVHVA